MVILYIHLGYSLTTYGMISYISHANKQTQSLHLNCWDHLQLKVRILGYKSITKRDLANT